MTDEEWSVVEEAVAGDPRMQEILGEREYIFWRESVWFLGGELVAGIARLEWDEPITVTYEWPTALTRDYYEHYGPELGLGPYREGVSEYTVYGLTGLEIWVDLQERRVIKIRPGPLPSAYDRIERPDEFAIELSPSPEEREQALKILEADARVQTILDNREYRISHVTGSRVGGARLAGVSIKWDDPEDIEADWPLAIDFDAETGEYLIHTAHFTAETVGELNIVIDLDKGQVMAIHPNVGD